MTARRRYIRQLFFATLVVLLTGIVLEPVWAQPPVEPGWRVFSEPGFGYQIQYPEGWHVSLVADNTQRAQSYGEQVALRSIGFFGPQSQIVFVDVWANRSGYSLAEWQAHYPAPFESDPKLSPSRETATIAGKPATRQVVPPADDSGRAPWHFRTQFADDDLIFSIEYAALEPALDIYTTMLSSFHLEAPGQSRSAPSSLSSDLPPAEFGVQTATCCGITDFEYNPFPCNTAGDAPCPAPPCGNCTWWVRYRRLGDSEANLVHCTNDALTWGACANQYYPHLLSPSPDDEAVVIYPGIDHLSFVESTSGNFFNGSDMSWFESCPANYFTSSSNGKTFIHHPNKFVPNMPPNAPVLDKPADEIWLNARSVNLSWIDGGDPDEGPEPYPDFLAQVSADNWSKHSSWSERTNWPVDVPVDGLYQWRVKAHDGLQESAWSTTWEFGVDTVPPALTFSGQPPLGQWYKTNHTLTWVATDPTPGSGIDYLKWDWDDNSPDTQINSNQGSTTLSQAGQGVHQLYVQAWDVAGNQSPVASLGWLGYDTVGPNIAFSAGNPTVASWYNQPVQLSWTVNDPAPGIGLGYFKKVWDTEIALQENLVIARTNGAQGGTALHPVQGGHTLYVKAWDALGNTAPIASLGWYGYDSLSPAPPTISLDCDIPNNQWQNTCRQPTFSWQSTDTGPAASGVVAYSFVWGPATASAPGNWSGVTGHAPPPVAPEDGQGKGYLHVWAKDAAGNISAPATFGVWYDGDQTGSLNMPQHPAADNVFRLNVSNEVLFTNVPTLTVQALAPNVTHLRLSTNPVFADQGWQTYTFSQTWLLTGTGDTASPHRLYAWFRDQAGSVYGPYFDDVLYDTLVPKGRVKVLGQSGSSINILAWAWDDNSGIVDMRLGLDPSLTGVSWQPYASSVSYPAGGSVVYLQFRDAAGNLSPIYGTDGSDSSLTEKAYLPLIHK